MDLTNDPTVTFTPLELGGKTYRLLFNLRALALAQKLTGVNFLHTVKFEDLDAEQYAALLCAGLKIAHPDLTQEQLSDLVTIQNFGQVLDALILAFNANKGSAGSTENPPNPTPAV